MQRNYSLLMTAAIALFSNVCIAQTSPGEPYIELTSEQETGKWGLSLAVANDEDKAKVWVDLNNNGQKDENEPSICGNGIGTVDHVQQRP